jgi:hypothetical protein
MVRIALALTLLVGCDQQKIALGQGGDDDARLFADVYTWQCEERSGEDVVYYNGVNSYQVSLEYAPDDLVKRDLPAAGCSTDLDMFPADAGSGGVNIPDAGNPSWANGDLDGTLSQLSDGFYFDDVYGQVENCSYAEDLIGEGTVLAEAGSFSGARSPAAGSLDDVEISNFDSTTGLTFGAEVEVGWSQKGWDDSWIQIRAESDGELVDSVTCNTGGSNIFAVDDGVWSLMNTAIEPDVTNLYVAVQNSEITTTADGQRIELVTRVIHAAVVR